jgi:uncharacterized membrane protein (DUF106 family)
MVFTEVIMQYPRITILGFAALISLFISIVNFFILDKEKLREIKKRQKDLSAEIKQHQKDGNHDKVMELNKELMAHIPETLKHSFKPMLITIIPVLIFFTFIKSAYAETAISSTWFWWYLGGAIASSLIFRKLFKLP